MVKMIWRRKCSEKYNIKWNKTRALATTFQESFAVAFSNFKSLLIFWLLKFFQLGSFSAPMEQLLTLSVLKSYILLLEN